MSVIQLSSLEEVQRIFDVQKGSYKPSNVPTYQQRLDRLERLEQLLRGHIEELTAALVADFGSRDPDQILGADFLSPLTHGRYVKAHLARWMKPERTSSGVMRLTGQKTSIVNEPLGVVGIMSPFNAPVSLAFDPALEALAAGNRVMIKISESTPKTADVLQKLVAHSFHEEEMAVVTGEANVSAYFAALAWDKFVFTGGSEIGKKILAAAALHLTPVILELGGKSPLVVLPDADLKIAGEKMALGRQGNAGQVCLSVDYALVPQEHLEEIIQIVVETDQKCFPTLIDNPTVSSIITQRSYDRIVGYIDEAKATGCRVLQVNPNHEPLPDPITRKIPLTLVINPDAHLQVSRSEVFGPVLSIYTYRHLDEAIELINSKEKPLGLYIFGKRRQDIQNIVNKTSSGGITINDIGLHAGSNTMGFGGVGYSGMGRYKGGLTGYHAFTNQKAVFEQGLLGRFTAAFFPPFRSDRARRMMRSMAGIR